MTQSPLDTPTNKNLIEEQINFAYGLIYDWNEKILKRVLEAKSYVTNMRDIQGRQGIYIDFTQKSELAPSKYLFKKQLITRIY